MQQVNRYERYNTSKIFVNSVMVVESKYVVTSQTLECKFLVSWVFKKSHTVSPQLL